jgi:hypothetical protein
LVHKEIIGDINEQESYHEYYKTPPAFLYDQLTQPGNEERANGRQDAVIDNRWVSLWICHRVS